MIAFEGFPKIGRLRRGITIAEKIDGTNACVVITEEGEIAFQSRSRIITPDNDNFGFSKWGTDNLDDLKLLGVGRHFGEWWGSGIQRAYGFSGGHRMFSLFNVDRWRDGRQQRPRCCGVVPLLYEGDFSDRAVDDALDLLRIDGSQASPGFRKAEGIVIYHRAVRTMFKITLENDEMSKGEAERLAA